MSEYEYGMGKKRGPYGSNVGDMWLTDETAIRMRRMLGEIDRAMIVEIVDTENGPQEAVYETEDVVLMADAAEGHLRFMAEKGMPEAFENWISIKAAKN